MQGLITLKCLRLSSLLDSRLLPLISTRNFQFLPFLVCLALQKLSINASAWGSWLRYSLVLFCSFPPPRLSIPCLSSSALPDQRMFSSSFFCSIALLFLPFSILCFVHCSVLKALETDRRLKNIRSNKKPRLETGVLFLALSTSNQACWTLLPD